MEVGKWLTKKFLEWQTQSGEKKTVTEFADFLGVSRDTLNKWFNGQRRPRGTNVDVLAAKLGPEIYDILGLRRPGEIDTTGLAPDVAALAQRINRLPPDVRESFIRLVNDLAKRSGLLKDEEEEGKTG